MAVDLTATDLRSFLGDGNVTEDRAGELLKVVKARVEGYAPDAATAVQNEAARRFCGYLLLADETGFGVIRTQRTGDSDSEFVTNHATGFRNSGAEAILTPFKKRRGGLI